MSTRKPPRGKKSVCAVRCSGGVTKGFDTLQELVDYIYAEYGSSWQAHISTKGAAQRRTTLPPNRATRATTPDEEVAGDQDIIIPNVPQVVTTTSTNITSRVRRCAGDGNCLYEALGYILGQSIPQVRQSLCDFIRRAPDVQLEGIAGSHGFSLRFVRTQAGVNLKAERWGETLDIGLYASVIGRSIRLCHHQNETRLISTYNPIDEDGTVLQHAPLATTLILYNGRDHFDALV